MNNLLENAIAAIIFTAVSTATGLIVQIFGFSAQTSITVAGAVLFGLAVVFLVVRSHYARYTRWRTERLLQKALTVKTHETDEARKTFKKKIIERVLLEDGGVGLKQNSSVIEFLNQEACESHIREASCNAKKVKVLTIRGEKYFLGPRSLLHDLCQSKRSEDSNIEVLVLSPDSHHISEELAASLDHESAEEIKAKMHIVFDYLNHLANRIKNFEVKCYDERPNFKILLFDDVMSPEMCVDSERLIELVQKNFTQSDIALIRRACAFAEEHYASINHPTGKPCHEYAFSVAKLLVDFGSTPIVICAAIICPPPVAGNNLADLKNVFKDQKELVNLVEEILLLDKLEWGVWTAPLQENEVSEHRAVLQKTKVNQYLLPFWQKLR